MDGQSVVSPEVIARYASDAACEVAGVARVVEGVRKGVRVDGGEIVLHLALDWGVSIPEVGASVQRRRRRLPGAYDGGPAGRRRRGGRGDRCPRLGSQA